MAIHFGSPQVWRMTHSIGEDGIMSILSRLSTQTPIRFPDAAPGLSAELNQISSRPAQGAVWLKPNSTDHYREWIQPELDIDDDEDEEFEFEDDDKGDDYESEEDDDFWDEDDEDDDSSFRDWNDDDDNEDGDDYEEFVDEELEEDNY